MTSTPSEPTAVSLVDEVEQKFGTSGGVFGELDPINIAMRRPKRQARRVGFWFACGWLGFVIFVAIFAKILPLHAYDQFVPHMEPRVGIGFRLPEPLGTDIIGRSMASRLAVGARQSLEIGIVSVTIAFSIGTVLGLTMGFLRGKVDAFLSIILDAMLAFPPLILLLAVASIGTRSVTTVIISLSIAWIAPSARLTRAITLSLANREFVIAARAMGATRRRIIFREIFPNVLPSVISVIFLFMASIIIAEGSLSFLGFGVPPPNPSWGGMVNEGRQVLSSSPQLVFLPSACLLFTVLAFRTVGERIRVRYAGGVSQLL
jgi:peptide/nickel transport system permease protein